MRTPWVGHPRLGLSHARSARRDGFTLIEVVISISLLMLVALTAYQTMSVSTRFHQTGLERLDQLRAQRIDRYRIRALTDQLRPWPVAWPKNQGKSQLRWFFRGARDSVEFVSPVSIASANDGRMRRIRLQADGKGGIKVTERIVIELANAKAPTGKRRIVTGDLWMEFPFELSESEERWIARDRLEIRFSYYGLQPLTQQYGWVDTWEYQPNRFLPEAIRVVGLQRTHAGLESEFQWVFQLPNRIVGWPEKIKRGGKTG